jgi:hypothetical protein
VGVRLGVVCGAVGVAFLLPVPAAAQLPELPLPDVPIVEEPEAPKLEAPTLSSLLETISPPPIRLLSTGEAGTSGEPSGSTSSGSGSTSSGSSSTRSTASSRNEGPRTRFDGLPRRYEVLLERILRGENVTANLRRLERALAAASPELRARMLRLVRREITSLERGRVTPAERRRIARLHRVERLLTRTDARGATPSATIVSAGAAASPGPALDSPAAGASEGAVGIGARGDGAAPKEEGTDVGSGAFGALGLPDGITLGTAVLVLVALLLSVAALAFAVAVVPSCALPRGRARHLVRTSRSDFAVIGLLVTATLLLVFLIGALV